MASSGQQATGSSDSDSVYDLVSVLYHALEGGATYTRYIQDAEKAGDTELAQFFRDVQEQEQQRAEHARQLLAHRLQSGPIDTIRYVDPS